MAVTGRDDGQREIGAPIDRIEGELKVTGGATYAADHRRHEVDGGDALLYGWIVEAPRGPGRIRRLDTSVALRQPGVVRVLSHLNRTQRVREWGKPDDAPDRFHQSKGLLVDARVRWSGQPVALVLAETLEAARGAALMVEVDVEHEPGVYGVTGHELPGELDTPESLDGDLPADVDHGNDFAAEYAACDHQLDLVYTTSALQQAALEPHATIASWDGESLTVRVAIQIVDSAVHALANSLYLEPAQVRVICPFTGGGFGSKLAIFSDATLASLAAIETGRPVKVVQTRRNVFTAAPHRGGIWQRVRLGADRDGRLRAVGHESIQCSQRGYDFAEPVGGPARSTYRCDALMTRHRRRICDIPAVDSMRAPGDVIGAQAYESAIDELARALEMDPLDLRLKNLPEIEPWSGKPFSRNDLGDCLETGAEAFGWRDRPAPHDDGRWRVGYGMAAAMRPNFLMESSARVTVDREGRVRVEADITEIGGGTYTILAQIVSEQLAVPISAITVDIGDSRHPATAGSGGSFGATLAGSAVVRACKALRARLVEVIAAGEVRLSDAEVAALHVVDGTLRGPSGALTLGEVVTLSGEDRLVGRGDYAPGDEAEAYAQHMFGAQYVELGVDRVTGEVRLRRVVGAFSFGRVLNHKTARSQLVGGMVFGIGGALNEGLEMDWRSGLYVNRDLAEYHLAVHRDIPALEVHILDRPDETSGEMASKGVGELGLIGIGAAIANAVHDATGVRVRDFPLTLDKVLAGLKPVAP